MSQNFQRARNDEDRETRRKIILKAASSLLSLKESSLPSVAQIVDKAGLGKGTFYLYYATKEEVYLALMAEGFSKWIEQVKQELQNKKVSLNSFLESYCSFCARHPQILHLATIAPTILEQNISETIAYEHKKYLSKEVFQIAELMSVLFEKPDFEKSRKLFISTYSMTLGLWMHCHPPALAEKILKKKEMEILKIDFQDELYHSLHALWRCYMEEIT